jgi:ABC-type antimicrobial peptide transport system permease subunit
LNEKAVQSLGWKDPGEAIGKQIRLPANPIIYTVEGVISDYHFASMQERIAPFIYFHIRTANVYRQLSLRINPGNFHQTISALQKKWQTVFPGSSFEYKFMDETLTKLYTTELQLKKAAYTATVLAMIIVLLGVVGLISLSVHKRIKEIGIRKVLGASLQNIIMLFVKDFIAIIIVAGVVAIPVAYLVMNGWLKNYAYRINISFQPFLWTIFSLASMTILLIAIQTVKTALANPVKSLRTE